MKTFSEFLSPLSVDEFFDEYFGRQPLVIRNSGGKFADLLRWDDFNRILGMNAYWNEKTLLLYKDQQQIPIPQYCYDASFLGDSDRRADPAKVSALFAEGATIVANYADTLTPAMNEIGSLLEENLFGFALANIYCSRFSRQGFKSHFDYHEVFAIHTEGEKTWRVYEGGVEYPVQHAKFRNRPPGFDDERKKRVQMEVTLTPGDILYIPRGRYHDATASSSASLHVTYGVQMLNGLDLIGGILERALDDALFRADLPIPRHGQSADALPAHLRRLGERLGLILQEPTVIANVVAAQRTRRLVRRSFELPGTLAAETPAAPRFSVSLSHKL